jgi:hypothetical protein
LGIIFSTIVFISPAQHMLLVKLIHTAICYTPSRYRTTSLFSSSILSPYLTKSLVHRSWSVMFFQTKYSSARLKIHSFLNFFLFYSFVHIMFESFLPPSPHHLLCPAPAPCFTPTYPSLPGRNYFALICNFVEERV